MADMSRDRFLRIYIDNACNWTTAADADCAAARDFQNPVAATPRMQFLDFSGLFHEWQSAFSVAARVFLDRLKKCSLKRDLAVNQFFISVKLHNIFVLTVILSDLQVLRFTQLPFKSKSLCLVCTKIATANTKLTFYYGQRPDLETVNVLRAISACKCNCREPVKCRWASVAQHFKDHYPDHIKFHFPPLANESVIRIYPTWWTPEDAFFSQSKI